MTTSDLTTPVRLTFRERHESRIRQMRLYAHTFAGSFSSMLGLVLVLLFLALAAFGPWLAPYPEHTTGAFNMAERLQPPSADHWFGTDEMGSDILSRVIVGARTSLWIGLLITGIGAGIGIPLGIIAGYTGGWTRAAIMRFTELFLAVPGLALALAIVAALGPGITNCVIALAIVWWPGYVRLVEAKTLSVKEELFVESARSWRAHALDHVAPYFAQLLVAHHRQDEHGHGHGDSRCRKPRFHRAGRTSPRARMGRDDLGRAQLHARLVVVFVLPRRGDLPDRARVQPPRRRPARHPRSPEP